MQRTDACFHCRLAARQGNRSRTVRVDKSSAVSQQLSSIENEVQWSIRQAMDTSEFRAAAYLRASCFYTYQEDRSEFAQRAHRRMKADAEWQSIENKVNGTEVAWERVRVVPFVASLVYDANHTVCREVRERMMDCSSQIPSPSPDNPPELAIGSLDLNIGVTLPAEELVGLYPSVDVENTRAYLSNVCVADGARRLGVAKALVDAASAHARSSGVLHVYVHVVEENGAALRLYRACGFEVESEESVDLARKRQHGRRLLLGRALLQIFMLATIEYLSQKSRCARSLQHAR
eukprot:TRINITY_DN8576_c0_g1_i3.p1 TRINITY_DN8576_c0_g1~~TRINITY_DN8576_c0_g1_i3.p1  ORF type:complete len:334 (+),score=25.40 TRINITY_DN8576_c0_g1_i3:130-1002(+)